MASIRIDSPFSLLSETFSLEPSSGEEPLRLQMGEVLAGRMVEWIDDHHAVLQLNGQDHLIESQFPLPGDLEGHFRVEANSPRVILKFIAEEKDEFSLSGPQLRQYLPDEVEDAFVENLGNALLDLMRIGNEALPSPVQTSVKNLLALLERFSIPSSSFPVSGQMEETVLRSGLFFEGRLRSLIESHLNGQEDRVIEGDLKGLLARLKSQLEALSSPAGMPKEISSVLEETEKGLDRILQKVEGYQFLNLPSPDSDGKFFLLLPVWFQSRLRFVEMALSLPRRDSEGAGRKGISILFLLDLPGLGKISIEVRVKEKALYCRFSVSDPKASLFLGRHVPELHTRLVRLGFDPQLSLSVDSPEKMTQTFLQEIGGERNPLFNLVV